MGNVKKVKKKKRVRFMIPGEPYEWIPEGFETVFLLKVLSPTTVRRILAGVQTVLDIDVRELKKKGKEVFGADFTNASAMALAKEAIAGWRLVEDVDGNEIEYDPNDQNLIDQIVDIEVLDLMVDEIQTKSMVYVEREKKS